tara:strand:+ start:766 stop:1365 length:600 start_codon:yes stop_codon:yes gene_type:complete
MTISNKRLKDMIAQEAAKMIAEKGIEQFGQAKFKAVDNLNVMNNGCLPSNSDIEKKLIEYYQLFQADVDFDHILYLRKIAFDVMHIFDNYLIYLVGPVANGSASFSSAINFHIASEDESEIIQTLTKNDLTHKPYDRKIKFNEKTIKQVNGIKTIYKNTDIELTIFNHKEIRHAPLSKIDNKPMKRIKIKLLQEMINPV